MACPVVNSGPLAAPGSLAESRCPRPSTPSSHATVRDEEPLVPQPGSRPSASPSPANPRLPTRAMSSSKCSSSTNFLRKTIVAPPSTESEQPGPWAGREGCTGAMVAQEEGSALDVAEALWWVAVSFGRRNLGIDLASSPRQADRSTI